MRLLILVFFILFSWHSFAFIPSSKMILDRTLKGNIEGPATIENDVTLLVGQSQVSLHETWIIENDQNYKLVVTGQKDLRDKIGFSLFYQNGQRIGSIGGAKVSEKYSPDFFERYFFLKNLNLFSSILGNAGIYNQANLNSSVFKRDNSKYIYVGEKNLSLSRVNGSPAWHFGSLSSSEAKMPGLWIEQDQFSIRKIRLASGAEMNIEKFAHLNKGKRIPKVRTINWESGSAEILMTDFKLGAARWPVGFSDKKNDDLYNSENGKLIIEFYSRFR